MTNEAPSMEQILHKTFRQLLELAPTSTSYVPDNNDMYPNEAVVHRWSADRNQLQLLRQNSIPLGAPIFMSLVQQYIAALDQLCQRARQPRKRPSSLNLVDAVKGMFRKHSTRSSGSSVESAGPAYDGDEPLETRSDDGHVVIAEIVDPEEVRRYSASSIDSAVSVESDDQVLVLDDWRRQAREVDCGDMSHVTHQQLLEMWGSMLQQLYDLGLDVNAVHAGSTLLDVLCSVETTTPETHEFVLITIRWLLERGAAVDGVQVDEPAQGPGRDTPLMRAFQSKSVDIAELLLDYGASLDAISAKGTPAWKLGLKLPTLKKRLLAHQKLSQSSFK